MPLSRACLMLLVLLTVNSPVAAGIFSRNKPKANPSERVPDLLIQLKSDKDEAKREAAAAELRQFDPKAHPEILIALVDALTKDTSTDVRSEAASSLGKLRPISQQAGYALEQATANDGSMRVRMAARQALWQYHLVGYRSGRPNESMVKTQEPPAAASMGPVAPNAKTRVSQRPATGPFRETLEPPLADPLPTRPAVVPPALPQGPPRIASPSPLVPVKAPKQASPPAANSKSERGVDKPSAPPPATPTPPPPASSKSDGPELPF